MQGSALKSCSSWKELAQPTSSTNSMISKQNLQSPADCLEMVEILETSGPTNYSHLVTTSRKKSVQKLPSQLFPQIRVEPKPYPHFFAQDTGRSKNSTVCEKICGITFFVWNRWNVEECLKFGSGGLGFMLPWIYHSRVLKAQNLMTLLQNISAGFLMSMGLYQFLV